MKISRTHIFRTGLFVGLTIIVLAVWLIASSFYGAEKKIKSQNILEYGNMCAEAIKKIPAFNCLDGDIVDITINGGQTPTQYAKNMDCDRPALFLYREEWSDGQCTPYTRVLNLSKGTAQISVMCRQKVIREPESPLFDEIDIIAHNTVDGSTCWFEALSDDALGINAERVPPPNEETPPAGHPSAESFWSSPADVAEKKCGRCHDNDPFMYSPYVEQVWNKLPADPQGWYKHIGPDFASWQQPMSLSTRQNPCVGCHRLGVTFTSGQGTLESIGKSPSPNADDWAKEYPASHWMPPANFHSEEQWNVIYQKAVQEILACYDDPTRPFCIIEPITGRP